MHRPMGAPQPRDPHTGWSMSGWLFRGLLTNVPTRLQSNGPARGVRTRSSTPGPGGPGRSQSSYLSLGTIDGCRSWISLSASVAGQVRIVNDQTGSAPLFQISHKPAKENGSPPSDIHQGCFTPPTRCHSNHPFAGTRHRRRRNASRNEGFELTDSDRALIRRAPIF